MPMCANEIKPSAIHVGKLLAGWRLVGGVVWQTWRLVGADLPLLDWLGFGGQWPVAGEVGGWSVAWCYPTNGAIVGVHTNIECHLPPKSNKKLALVRLPSGCGAP